MTRPPDETPERPAAERSQADERERRRRRARVFGEVLPDGTTDETAAHWGDGDEGPRSEEWLRGEVPPHHG